MQIGDARWIAGARVAGGQTVLHCLSDRESYPDLLPANASVQDIVDLVRRAQDGGLSVHLRNTEGLTAFMSAAVANRVDVMDALLRAGADPGARSGPTGSTALHLCAAVGSESAVRFLLDAPATSSWRDAHRGDPLWRQVDDDERTPLHIAAAPSGYHCPSSGPLNLPSLQAKCRIAELLLLAGQDGHIRRSTRSLMINAVNLRGRTALMESESPEMVDLLMRWGADCTLRDDTGATAAHWAAYRGHVDVLRVLHEGGGLDVGATDVRGLTVLHEACQYSQPLVVRFLVQEAGADVKNHTAHTSYTPLHYAMAQHDADIVRTLLEAGASLSARAVGPAGLGSGPTALDVGSDAMVEQALEWVPDRAEVMQIAADVSAFVAPDLAALVAGFRCVLAAEGMPYHREMVEDILSRRATERWFTDNAPVAARVIKRRRGERVRAQRKD